MRARAQVKIRCPYAGCGEENTVDCEQPVGYQVVDTCWSCDGRYVVDFAVMVEARALKIEGQAAAVKAVLDSRERSVRVLTG